MVPFVKFIPRYFIVFEAIINGVVSLISFSVFLLLVYKKATYFCMLIVYPATSLKEFIISISFLVEFLGFLRYRIMSSANRDSLISFLPFESLLFPAVVLFLWLGIKKLH
jgi:hypothetical protein